MPNRSSKRDFSQIAFAIVQQAAGETPLEPPASSVSEDTARQVMREMGRRGGLKGGKARAESLSKKRKKEIATLAAKSRWSKKNEETERK